MKTREQIVTSMCYTWRHDYGLKKLTDTAAADPISAGMTDQERQTLWNQMAQIYDNCIAPHMMPKDNSNKQWTQYHWNILD